MNDYERRRAELEKCNQPLLEGFLRYLLLSKVSQKAAREHIDRISFFSDVFLIECLNTSLADGYDEISEYLGHWFIRKVMWSDVTSLKANVQTFEKFYAFLHSIGHIAAEDLAELNRTIVLQSPAWIRYVQRYNDPRIEAEDVWSHHLDEMPSPTIKPSGPLAVSNFTLMLSGLTAKHFGIAPRNLRKVDDLEGEGHWAACWRCDLVGSDHQSGTFYFMFTNSRTLYSLVVPNNDRGIGKLFADFVEILHHQLRLLGCETAPLANGSFMMVRGQPRSLIGSQNDLISLATRLFEEPDPSLDMLCLSLNRTPMSAIKEVFPDRAFASQLAADPPLATAKLPNIIEFPRPHRN